MDVKRVLEATDKALSTLPMDGKKTTTGATIYVVGKLLSLIPGMQWLAVPGVLEAIGTVVMGLGVIHKAAKAGK